ncbi:TasA family protein [Bacillus sp. 1P06AnD]|uniref:TasA family protein n=1 Tax=Bacillus sp. 1P06AnD TaxID=3132208 RepID=UPI0039A36C74
MGLKTKLAVGIMSGALGLSLVGGGTWAAFNDVETVSNTFAAGTLDLGKGDATEVFNISNLKPGDSFKRSITLKNEGSLDINQIFLNASSFKDWKDKDVLGLNGKLAGAGNNSIDEFLGQFTVTIKKGSTFVYGENGSKTLADLKAEATGNNGSGVEITGTDNKTVGLASGDKTTAWEFEVKFKEDNALISGTRLHAQNKYQGEGAKIDFVFEATQMPGESK